MKKSLSVLLVIFSFTFYPVNSQGVFNRVRNTVAKEMPGTNNDQQHTL